MKEYTELIDFYNTGNSVVNNYQKFFLNFSSSQKIDYIRLNSEKTLLNSYIHVGILSKNAVNALGINTVYVKLSMDTLIKNIIEHPELTFHEYSKIESFIKNPDYIFKKNDKNLIYFKIDEQIYQLVIKSTKTKNETYVTTFHKASVKQLQKDKCRYLHIKTDSSDYEDSNYPSVT